jgi:hypothetical protein
MPGQNVATPLSNTVPEGSQLVNVNVMCVVASDEEALALKRKVSEALAGTRTLRNTFTISDVPSQATPTVG